MPDELSALGLKEDFEKVARTTDAACWDLQLPAPLEVWAMMHPASHPDERFQARLLWNLYPDQPPSLKFRDPATGRLDVSAAWPVVPGFRPSNLDACVNWCLEGQNLHPEWRNDPKYRWDPRGNVLLKVLRILQEQLDEHYGGRHP